MSFYFGSTSYFGVSGYDFGINIAENDVSTGIGGSQLDYLLSYLNFKMVFAS